MSTNDMVDALPGRLIFTCVPTTIGYPRIAEDAGLIPIVACPVLNDLPYLSLNPPGLSGIDRTGRPDITSSNVDSLGFLLFESLSDCIFSNHSQSEMLRSLISLNSFLFLPIIFFCAYRGFKLILAFIFE